MLRVAVLMAGKGKRFSEKGYQMPKPLIDVNGKPMIQRVVENINLNASYTFYVLKEHYELYSLKYLLPLICKNNPCRIILVDKVTEGAACTALLDDTLESSDDELLIANSDQLVEWDGNHFLSYLRNKKADGGIVTFTASDPKWSYVKTTNETNIVTEVVEKQVVSNLATAGLYYFYSARDFVLSVKLMINKNIRTNGEFYLAPSYNELISKWGNVYSYPVPEVHGLGTPEDYERYLSAR